MAIVRKQFITVVELNEILGASYENINENIIKIYEASELVHYHSGMELDYDVLTAPDNLKLITAYQVAYMENNGDDEYEGTSFSIGKYSSSSSDNGEYKKISPKAQRLMSKHGYLRR